MTSMFATVISSENTTFAILDGEWVEVCESSCEDTAWEQEYAEACPSISLVVDSFLQQQERERLAKRVSTGQGILNRRKVDEAVRDKWSAIVRLTKRYLDRTEFSSKPNMGGVVDFLRSSDEGVLDFVGSNQDADFVASATKEAYAALAELRWFKSVHSYWSHLARKGVCDRMKKDLYQLRTLQQCFNILGIELSEEADEEFRRIMLEEPERNTRMDWRTRKYVFDKETYWMRQAGIPVSEDESVYDGMGQYTDLVTSDGHKPEARTWKMRYHRTNGAVNTYVQPIPIKGAAGQISSWKEIELPVLSMTVDGVEWFDRYEQLVAALEDAEEDLRRAEIDMGWAPPGLYEVTQEIRFALREMRTIHAEVKRLVGKGWINKVTGGARHHNRLAHLVVLDHDITVPIY